MSAGSSGSGGEEGEDRGRSRSKEDVGDMNMMSQKDVAELRKIPIEVLERTAELEKLIIECVILLALFTL